MNIESYDALVLVHPDWYSMELEYNWLPRNPVPKDIQRVYDKFNEAQEICTKNNIPLMIDFFDDESLSQKSLFTNYTKVVRESLQIELSRITGKDPEELSVLFGGLRYNSCVRKWVGGVCQNIETTADDEIGTEKYISGFMTNVPTSEWYGWRPRSDKLIGTGKICYELTDKFVEHTFTKKEEAVRSLFPSNV